MSRSQHDYDTLRREYISSDISIRALAEKHGIKSWSTVNAKKKAEDWDAQRELYKQKMAEGEVGALVQERLKTISAIHDELLFAVRAAVRNYISSVTPATEGAEPAQQVSARDLMGMIDKFLLLSGSTPHRMESRSVDAHSYSFDGLLEGAPPELLRQLADLAGDRGARQQPVGRGPLVVLEGVG